MKPILFPHRWVACGVDLHARGVEQRAHHVLGAGVGGKVQRGQLALGGLGQEGEEGGREGRT